MDEGKASDVSRREKGNGERGETPLRTWIGLGVGAGIGSAALAAALLYASRGPRRRR